MKSNLENILKSFGGFSDEDISFGLSNFVSKHFKKDEILLEAGKTCKWIAFINSGIVRNYYISSNNEEVTYCMTFPNNFITAYSSFISGEKTFENIHALSETEALFIKKEQLLKLTNSSKKWLEFSNHFAEQAYVIMEHRLLTLQRESAEKRYEELITNHPEYLQYVPLKYIASYLGITQRHLSRLRKNIAY
ncbi:Crp/Fnr family transcriptional regulator [Salibacter halophilus]|uniref:Crp/Fnr family transcriptional regulator n=1 Tax=Salibacter halophilus TaxID=1803916 RepID=A0A6N6MAV3_9FLAO|nr:Crp/Fnr family transcriptional regulator [Salibacter halophilus]KAB1065577.1 Crp/Fnr family transcriptional regulator [Salibacter halophilus]